MMAEQEAQPFVHALDGNNQAISRCYDEHGVDDHSLKLLHDTALVCLDFGRRESVGLKRLFNYLPFT